MFINLSLADECDDEDDPEYNFLADTDEPDVEDYRDDKAVRITSQYSQIQKSDSIHHPTPFKHCYLFKLK